MFNLNWSASEKKIAREAYDRALEAAKSKALAEFRKRANAVTSAPEMWAVERWLYEQRKEIGEMFDYRYSQLPLVFAWAIRVGHMDEVQLAGLSKDKLDIIRRLTKPLVS